MDEVDKILAQWRKELPGLSLGGMELFGHLGRIGMLATRKVNDVFTRNGLKLGEFDVLASLRRAGKPYRLTPTQLFQGLMLSSGAMTNRLDNLERAGLVERAPDPADRRGTLICLTPKGKELVEKVVREHTANEDRLAASLSAAERKQLVALLKKFAAGLAAAGDGDGAISE